MTSNLRNAKSEQEFDKAASTSGTVRLHVISPFGRLPFMLHISKNLEMITAYAGCCILLGALVSPMQAA